MKTKKVSLGACISIFVSLLFLVCNDTGTNNTGETTKIIALGQFWGECMGACSREIVINGRMATISRGKYWQRSDIDSAQFSISDSTADLIRAGFELNSLDTVNYVADDTTILRITGYGQVITPGDSGSASLCIDCVDGGGEWMELNVGGRISRIVYPINGEIAGTRAAQIEMRRLLADQDSLLGPWAF